MEIGLIRPYEIEYNNKDIIDLDNYIRAQGHGVSMVYVDMLGIKLGKDGISIYQTLSRSERTPIEVDGAIMRHLGLIKDFEQFGHRIWAVRAMEQKGIRVINPVLSWLAAGDKLAALAALAKSGIPVPDTISSEHMFIGYDAVKEFGHVVIKQLRSNMGFGVFRIDDPDVAFQVFSYFINLNKPLYVQKYLNKRRGGDYRVIVVGGEAIGAEFRKGLNWKSNVAQGAKPMATKMPAEMREMAVKSAEILGLDYVGVDIAETKDGYYVLETNPTISWQGFKKATGINPAEKIVEHLIRKIKS